MNVADLMSPQEWRGAIVESVAKYYPRHIQFEIAMPCRLNTSRQGLIAFIGEEKLDVVSAKVVTTSGSETCHIGLVVCEGEGEKSGEIVWVDIEREQECLTPNFVNYLADLWMQKDAMEFDSTNQLVEDKREENRLADGLAINKDNPTWGSW